MVIVVRDVALSADTADQGTLLFAQLDAALSLGDDIVVSFADISTTTSSFVNASFVELLKSMPFDDIKRRVRVVCSTKQINDMIKRRLQREASVVCA